MHPDRRHRPGLRGGRRKENREKENRQKNYAAINEKISLYVPFLLVFMTLLGSCG